MSDVEVILSGWPGNWHAKVMRGPHHVGTVQAMTKRGALRLARRVAKGRG